MAINWHFTIKIKTNKQTSTINFEWFLFLPWAWHDLSLVDMVYPSTQEQPCLNFPGPLFPCFRLHCWLHLPNPHSTSSSDRQPNSSVPSGQSKWPLQWNDASIQCPEPHWNLSLQCLFTRKPTTHSYLYIFGVSRSTALILERWWVSIRKGIQF